VAMFELVDIHKILLLVVTSELEPATRASLLVGRRKVIVTAFRMRGNHVRWRGPTE
jgi:hypothetical protein